MKKKKTFNKNCKGTLNKEFGSMTSTFLKVEGPTALIIMFTFLPGCDTLLCHTSENVKRGKPGFV
jgi:hypothetical protein